MTPTRPLLAALAAAALLGACDARVTGAQADAVLGLCRTATSRVHDALASCEGATAPQLQAWKSADEVFCQALSREVATGRARFDAERGKACTSSLAAVACGDAVTAGGSPSGALALPACDGAVAGGLGMGATCLDDVECGTGLYCTAAIDGTCPGTCAPAAAPGESCDARPCGPGLACDFGGSTTCRPASGAGGPCPCAASAYCDRTGAAPACRATKPSGTACAGPSECAAGLACAGAPSTCQPFSGVGAACTPIAPGCAPGLACAPASGTCQPAPGLGESCVVTLHATTYTLPCLDGFCDATGARTCQAIKADGQPCRLDVECRGFCDASSHLCAGGSGLACPGR